MGELRDLRIKAGLTQPQVAEYIKVNISAISNLPVRKSNKNLDPYKVPMYDQLRNLVTKSVTMAGKLDEILSVGGNWEELVAKSIIEANKIGDKVHYIPSRLKGHITFRREKQKNPEYLRGYDINDEGVFPKNK